MTAAVTAVFLVWGNLAGWLSVSELFGAVAVFGIATAFEGPAAAALLPATVRAAQLQKGTVPSTGAMQAANITGPALGGIAYAVAPPRCCPFMPRIFCAWALGDWASCVGHPLSVRC